MQNQGIFVTRADLYHNASITIYPDGRRKIVAADGDVFRDAGFELAADVETGDRVRGSCDADAMPSARAIHRAKSAIRDLVLSNKWDYWVTLTVASEGAERVRGVGIRYDYAAQIRRMRTLLDNLVRRKGALYVLVPELHDDGAIHYHGFVRGFRAVWSGTMQPPGGGKPRRVKSSERAEKRGGGWHDVYNLPEWVLGFSTAIPFYGDPLRAASYACKYAAKQMETGKIGGRYYLSGGDLQRPAKVCADVDIDELRAAGAFEFPVDFGTGRLYVLWLPPE